MNDNSEETDGADDRLNPPLQDSIHALLAVFFTNGVVYASYISRLAEIREQSAVSLAGLGVILTLGSLAGLVVSIFSGILVPRAGTKRLILAASILHAVSLPAIGLSHSAVILVVAFVALGTFDALADVSSNVQGSTVSALSKRPVMSRFHGFWSLGTLVGAGSSVLAAGAGVSVLAHFLVVSLLVAVVTVVVAPRLRRVDTRHPRQMPSEPSHRQSSPRWLWFGRAAALLAVANATVVAVDVSLGEWSSLRLSDDIGASAGVAAAGFLVYTSGLTLGRLAGDRLGLILGQRSLVRIGVAVALAGLPLATLLDIEWLTLLGMGLTGLGLSVISPQLADVAARAPGPSGAGFSTLFVGHRVAALTTPFLVGFAAESRAFDVGGAIAVVALPSLVLLGLLIGKVVKAR